jgi:hypothetical protein
MGELGLTHTENYLDSLLRINMLYQFKCKNCGYDQEEVFPAVDYDKKVKDGKLKRVRCKECDMISLYRHITEAPKVLGGTKGYVSMERWCQKHEKHKGEELENRLKERRRKKMEKINKQTRRQDRNDRYKGYGEGQSEERLRFDE